MSPNKKCIIKVKRTKTHYLLLEILTSTEK